MMRWDIINHLIKQYNYKTYLEIGYYKGWSFDRIECDRKVAVDPYPSRDSLQESLPYGNLIKWKDEYIYKMTSDDYFKMVESTGVTSLGVDIIFIDGLHKSEQVDRDIQNALKHLNPGGTIVMHDCNPSVYEMTTTGTPLGEWTGDVYKSFIHTSGMYGRNRYVVDTDYGVGVLRPLETEKGDLIQIFNNRMGRNLLFPDLKWPELTYSEFNEHRSEFLNLITPEEFLKLETTTNHNLPA